VLEARVAELGQQLHEAEEKVADSELRCSLMERQGAEDVEAYTTLTREREALEERCSALQRTCEKLHAVRRARSWLPHYLPTYLPTYRIVLTRSTACDCRPNQYDGAAAYVSAGTTAGSYSIAKAISVSQYTVHRRNGDRTA
jgi:hypothetical protein